jgi:hypothetical protein
MFLWFESEAMAPLGSVGMVVALVCEKRVLLKPGPGALIGVCREC